MKKTKKTKLKTMVEKHHKESFWKAGTYLRFLPERMAHSRVMPILTNTSFSDIYVKQKLGINGAERKRIVKEFLWDIRAKRTFRVRAA